MNNVLFLCRNNSCLSLMAEAYMSAAGRGVWRAWSAAVEDAGEVDPRLPDFLRRVGVRKLNLYSKTWHSFAVHGAPRMHLAVLIRDLTESLSLPDLPGNPEPVIWPVSSLLASGPAASDQQLVGVFAEIRRHADTLLLASPGLDRRIA